LTVAAAALWGAAAIVANHRWPPPRKLVQHLAAGAVMMGLYLTLSFLAIAHGLPAGIMALLGALQPLFTAALMLARGKGSPSSPDLRSAWWVRRDAPLRRNPCHRLVAAGASGRRIIRLPSVP